MNIKIPYHTQKAADNRILSIDSLRGFAMVLVIMQHSYLSANMKIIPQDIDLLIWEVTSLAAVAFVAISGMMYSFFLYSQSDWRSAYQKYAARNALLIIAAHPLITLTSLWFHLDGKGSLQGPYSFLEWFFYQFPITDTIGICMLISPLAIICLRTVPRAATIVGLLIVTMIIRVFVIPTDPHLFLLKEALFGGIAEPKIFWFPLVPWLAIFLTGSFIGQSLVRQKQGVLEISSLIKQLNIAGVALAACSVILIIMYKFIKITFKNSWNPDTFHVIYPGQTTALLPGYLAILTWLMAAWMRRIDISGRYDRFSWLLSIFGRTSLFTYVVQFAVVESAPALLGYKGALGLTGFISLFALGLIVMWFLSYSYGYLRGWFSQNNYEESVNIVKDRVNSITVNE
jgi:uncharacterized membrane protein